MSPKRRLLFSSSSSGNNPPIPAPARQGRDGEGEEDNGDEVVSSNVLLGENVMPAHGGREEGSHDDSSDYESESDAASPEPTLQSKRGVPSSKLAKKPSPPKRKAVVAELAESSTAKKKAKSAPPKMGPAAELVKPPPPKPPADLTKSPKKAAAAKQVAKSRPPKKAAAPAATAAEVAKLPEAKGAAADAPSGAENDHQAQRVLPYNAENLLEEKSERYWYLRQVVRSLEADHGHPGLFNAAFLKMDDAKATALNKKIIKQRLAECKVYNKRWDINKEIIGVMYNLMK